MNPSILTIFLAALACVTAAQAQSSLTAEAKGQYQTVRNNILKAAEKMPDAGYDFSPTPEVRSFGQLVGHVADAQMGICGLAKGETKRGDAKSKNTKRDLVAALKASNDFCDAAYIGMTDADGLTTVKLQGHEQSRLSVLNLNVAHDNEMYGTIAVYLRLKGIVPPSTADAP